MSIRIFVVILTLISPALVGGELISELQGMPWAGSPETAKQRLLRLPGLTLKANTSDSIVFVGGSWGDFPVEWGTLEFKENRLSHATIYFTCSDATYNRLRNTFAKRFGQ